MCVATQLTLFPRRPGCRPGTEVASTGRVVPLHELESRCVFARHHPTKCFCPVMAYDNRTNGKIERAPLASSPAVLERRTFLPEFCDELFHQSPGDESSPFVWLEKGPSNVLLQCDLDLGRVCGLCHVVIVQPCPSITTRVTASLGMFPRSWVPKLFLLSMFVLVISHDLPVCGPRGPDVNVCAQIVVEFLPRFLLGCVLIGLSEVIVFCHGPRLHVCQAPNAFKCVSPNAFTCVSPNAFVCVSPNAFITQCVC